MTDFWQSDTYKIVEMMKATGNAPGLIERWKNMVEGWVQCNAGPDVEAAKAWLPMWQVRPFYTAAELAPLFPVLAVTLGLRKKPGPIKSANRLENELIFARLPALGTYYLHDMRAAKYFIVERQHFWLEQNMTQRDFEKLMWEISNAQR